MSGGEGVEEMGGSVCVCGREEEVGSGVCVSVGGGVKEMGSGVCVGGKRWRRIDKDGGRYVCGGVVCA